MSRSAGPERIRTAAGEDGVVVSRRSSLRVLRAVVRNPLEALPPEVFHARMVVSRVFRQNRIYLADPALIHEVLVRQADSFSKGVEIKRVLGPALGEGLLTADGASWRRHRQTMAPAFQHARLTAFLPAMIAAAENARERWMAAGERIDIGHEMMVTTFQIIVETMLSGPGEIDAAGIERGVTDYLRATNWMFALAILRAPTFVPYPGRRKTLAAAAALRETVAGMVRRRRAASPRDDLVGLLLAARDPETGSAMADADVTDNLLTFVTAGHETTALGLGWTFQLLARHPDVARQVADEIDAIVGNGPVEPAHVERLAYTRQVFQEAMRLYPPAPLISRTAEQPITLAGRTIAPGTVILIPIYAVHHHAKLWDDPHRFDPGRFAPDAAKARPRYAFMPFGGGVRVCIGSTFALLEGVAILAVLLKAFRLRPTEEPLPAALMRVTLRPHEKQILSIQAR